MSENTPNPGQPEPTKDNADLLNELREMGQTIETAFRTFVESDRAKQMQSDVARSVREVTSAMRDAAEKLQSDPRVAEAEERGRQAFDRARESQAFHDLQAALVGGLSHLNEQLRKLVEKLEADRAASSNPPTEHVPVEQPPATGETTKLD